MTTAIDPRQAAPAIERKERSLLQDSFRRLLKNRLAIISGLFIIGLTLAAFPFASIVAPQDPATQVLTANNSVPDWMMFILPEGSEAYVKINNDYSLSADHLGRDIFSRAIYGARVSLMIAFVASTVSLIIGTLYGSVSGYVGGATDNIMMRIIDLLYAFPFLIVVILLQTYFKAVARQSEQGGSFSRMLISANESMGGLLFLFIAIGLINWLGLARVARAQVLSQKNKEFVEAARAMGASSTRIMFQHILPNIFGPLIVLETLAIPGYIFTEAFLSFIGLGVDPPTPSWGIMISDAVPALRTYPNQILVPAIFLTLTTLAFNFLGDGLRDAFDPRQRE